MTAREAMVEALIHQGKYLKEEAERIAEIVVASIDASESDLNRLVSGDYWLCDGYCNAE